MDTLRAIAAAGDDYQAIRRLLAGTQWEVDEDDVGLGFLRIFIPDPAAASCFRLIIGYRDPVGHPPYCILTFCLFPPSEEHIAAFNAAFSSAAESLTQFFGAPTAHGEHHMSFRSWPYACVRWSLPDVETSLLQDEFDIQEGMDVTLWMRPAGTPISTTLHW